MNIIELRIGVFFFRCAFLISLFFSRHCILPSLSSPPRLPQFFLYMAGHALYRMYSVCDTHLLYEFDYFLRLIFFCVRTKETKNKVWVCVCVFRPTNYAYVSFA